MPDTQVVPPSESLRTHSLSAAFRGALFWAVMFGAGELSFVLFASHIKASLLVFALLAGIPSLLGPLAQTVAANLLETRNSRMSLVLTPVLVQALSFLPLAILPFFPRGAAVDAVFLACVIVYFVMFSLVVPPWYSLIGDLLPADKRGDYFAKLTRLPTLIHLVTSLCVGGALYLAAGDALEDWVFAGAFALACAARLISYSIVREVREPPYHKSASDYFNFWMFIRRAPESNFVKFVVFTAFLHFGAYIAGPYFMPYVTYDLHFKTWHWVLVISGGTLASIATMVAWGRFSDRFGNKRTIQITAFLISVVPFTWLLTTNIWLIILIHTIGAAFWAGFSISTWNYIMEAASPPKRARCVAYYNVIVGVGIFLGSMAGERLSHWLPHADLGDGRSSSFPSLLVASGTLRLLACLVFLPAFKELRTVPEVSLTRWFFTVTQMRSVYGLLIGVIAEREESSEKNSGDQMPPPNPPSP
jgi:MFS family permease